MTLSSSKFTEIGDRSQAHMAGCSAQPLCHSQPPSPEGFRGGDRVTLWQPRCPKASPARVGAENQRRGVRPSSSGNVEVAWDGVINRVEKLAKLHDPMAAMTAANDRVGLDVQRRKERRGAVAHVI